MVLDREAGAATAAGCRIWIVDLERGADQFGREVDFRAVHEFQAHFIDQDADAVSGHDQIVFIGGIVEIELVRESRAAAAFDGNP